MKKKWKIFLSVFVLLLLVAGGTIYYFFKVKEYDVADENVEKIVDSEYDIVLPDDDADSNVSGSGGESNNTQTETGTETVATSENQTNSDATTNSSGEGSGGGQTTENKVGNTEKTVTVAMIKDKYRPSFENLQNQANSKIDTLVNAAYSEFKAKKQNGESISFAYFYQKYSGAGKALEEKTDSAFQIVYKALQNELQRNGFSTSHAKDFLEEYNAAKSARESALLNKAKEAL